MSKDFFNARAAIWDEQVTEQDASKLKAMADRLDIKPGEWILDVGTGTGVFVPYLLEKIGENGKLVCLDFAEEMLRVAKLKEFPGNIEYRCAAVEASGLPDGEFDAVVCYSVFPHFEDKPKALGEMSRMLRSRGRLFICHTSNRVAINEIHRSLPEVCSHIFPENDETRRMLENAGFEAIDIRDGEDYYLVSARKQS
jgi:ubiquinone/menaquinone biosynthesis C-methylase UbiE